MKTSTAGVSVGLALLGLVATSVWAQGIPVPSVVQVETPDGGLAVTLGAQRVSVEATGPGGSAVEITGNTVSTLAPATITALGPDTCTVYPRAWQDISPSAASAVPPNLPDGGSGGLEGRTHLLLVNTDDINNIACSPMQSDGGLPQWGVLGTPLFKNGGSNTWPIKGNVVMYCRAKAGSVVKVSPEELICAKVP